MAEQRLKHFGWGREGEGMTPAEETAALDSSNRGRRRNVLCRCSGGGLGGRGSGGWRVLGRRWASERQACQRQHRSPRSIRSHGFALSAFLAKDK
jgi:hypothetical protein